MHELSQLVSERGQCLVIQLRHQVTYMSCHDICKRHLPTSARAEISEKLGPASGRSDCRSSAEECHLRLFVWVKGGVVSPSPNHPPAGHRDDLREAPGSASRACAARPGERMRLREGRPKLRPVSLGRGPRVAGEESKPGRRGSSTDAESPRSASQGNQSSDVEKLRKKTKCDQGWLSARKNCARVVMFIRIWPPAKSSVNNAGYPTQHSIFRLVIAHCDALHSS
jgi:hypothetical protein